jgi:hypothetical protein
LIRTKRPSRRFWIFLFRIGGALYILDFLVGFFVLPKVIDHVLENCVSDKLDNSITLEEASDRLSRRLAGTKPEDSAEVPVTQDATERATLEDTPEVVLELLHSMKLKRAF